MAPLSRELAGLIQSHYHCGSHLDSDGRTLNMETEKANFGYAGKVPAEASSSMMTDSRPVVAEYTESCDSEPGHGND